MKIKELIKVLKSKDHVDEVEFIIVKIDGQIVAMDVSQTKDHFVNFLNWFKKYGV